MKIRWEESAILRLENIKAYLIEEFGLKVSENFAYNSIQIIESLIKHPEKGQISKKNKEVRKIHLTKTVVAFYTVLEKEIVILNVFDQRNDPNKSKF